MLVALGTAAAVSRPLLVPCICFLPGCRCDMSSRGAPASLRHLPRISPESTRQARQPSARVPQTVDDATGRRRVLLEHTHGEPRRCRAKPAGRPGGGSPRRHVGAGPAVRCPPLVGRRDRLTSNVFAGAWLSPSVRSLERHRSTAIGRCDASPGPYSRADVHRR